MMKQNSNGFFSRIYLLLFASLFLSVGCGKCQGEPQIYLVPNGYLGEVQIVYGVDSGEPIEYEGEFRVYRIPKRGILITQFSWNDGWVKEENIKYFYNLPSGERLKLPYVAPHDLKDLVKADTNYVVVYREQSFQDKIAFFVCPLKDCGDMYEEVRHGSDW